MTTTAITAQQQQQQVMVPQDKLQLVRAMYAPGCTDNEFQVLIELANRYQLDPFARQIWAVKYGNKPAQIFTGRDGYLAIAHRSGMLNGMEPEIILAEDNKTVIGAKCTVWRRDMEHPFVGYAYMDEDNQKQSVWLQRPKTMLIKVAEARALRHAFSISGLHSPEEFPDPQEPVRVAPRDTDITVRPGEYAPDTKHVYTQDMMDSAEKNIRDMGWDTEGLQSRARMRNGMYNADIVDAEYAKAREAVAKTVCPNCGKPSMSPKEVSTARTVLEGTGVEFDQKICRECAQKLIDELKKKQQPKRGAESTIDMPFCRDCGDKRVTPSDEKMSREKYKVPLCESCYKKRLEADIKASSKPAHVCAECGAELTTEEVNKNNMFCPGKPMLCDKCTHKHAPSTSSPQQKIGA